MKRSDALLIAVQEVLFRERDPIGVNNDERCRDEYNSYAPTISRWLQEGVDEYKLAQHLSELQRNSIGMTVIDEEMQYRIARRLLSLRSKPSGS